MEVLFYWFLNPCIYVQTLYSLPGQAEANIGSAVLLVSESLYLHTNSLQLTWAGRGYIGSAVLLVSESLYLRTNSLQLTWAGGRLTLEVLFYWFLNPCIYIQTLYSLPGQAEANIGSAVLLVSESLYLHTNSLQLTWAG